MAAETTNPGGGVPVQAALCAVVLVLVLLLLWPSDPPGPVVPPEAGSPAASPELDALAARVSCADSPLEARLQAIRELVSRPEPARVARLVALAHGPRAEHVSGLQVRASLVTALGAFSGDAEARAALAGLLAPDQPREERLLAIAVLAASGGASSLPGLETLEHDPDATVREKAEEATSRVRARLK